MLFTRLGILRAVVLRRSPGLAAPAGASRWDRQGRQSRLAQSKISSVSSEGVFIIPSPEWPILRTNLLSQPVLIADAGCLAFLGRFRVVTVAIVLLVVAPGAYASGQHPRQARWSAAKRSGGNGGLGLLVRLPIPGKQVGDFVGEVIWKPGQHVGEPGLRIDVVHLAGFDQGIDGGGTMAACV
jgi:hypothetical protein